MRLRTLKHLLDAVTALARPKRIVVIGSSSLLPHHPDLGEEGQFLEASYDSDLLLTPIDEELAAIAAKDSSFQVIKFVDKKITVAELKPYLADRKTVFYLSGPEAMVDSYEDLLGSLGVEQTRIMTDYFPGY